MTIIERNPSVKKYFSKTLDDKWGTDDFIAEWLVFIADKATKWISTKDDWIVDVPDYQTRLKAYQTIAKAKWLLNDKEKQSEDIDWIFVFVN